MISVSEALTLISAHSLNAKTEELALREVAGRISAKPIKARLTQPPFDSSAMDGYAVKFTDVTFQGATLEVIGEAPAGMPFEGVIKAGQAVRIFTGGVVPKGADHVIIQEDVTRNGEQITIDTPSLRARNIRKAGQDFANGDTLIPAETQLNWPHIALIAAANIAKISVIKRPHVAILSNGNELKEPGSQIATGQIINSNPYALAALIESWGGVATILPIAEDSVENIKARIAMAKEADIILPVGGASVGDHDHMKPAFTEAGLDMKFSKIAVKPGKPTWFGTLGAQRVLGLPGNPASALVCAHLFLKPLMNLGQDQLLSAALSSPLPASGPRETYARGRVDDGHIMLFPKQDSALISPFPKANALIQIPPNAGPWTAGDQLNYVAL